MEDKEEEREGRGGDVSAIGRENIQEDRSEGKGGGANEEE